jgi:hypothetical protein
MRFATVAEGVETTMQARVIRGYGCDLAQGYLFSRPLPPHELCELLAEPEIFRSTNLMHLVARMPEATGARVRTPGTLWEPDQAARSPVARHRRDPDAWGRHRSRS